MPKVATSQLGVCLCGTIDPKYTSGSSSTVSIISAHEAPQASFDETYHDDDSNDVQNFANSFQQLKPTPIGSVGPTENYHRQVMPKKPLDIRGISDENRSQKYDFAFREAFQPINLYQIVQRKSQFNTGPDAWVSGFRNVNDHDASSTATLQICVNKRTRIKKVLTKVYGARELNGVFEIKNRAGDVGATNQRLDSDTKT